MDPDTRLRILRANLKYLCGNTNLLHPAFCSIPAHEKDVFWTIPFTASIMSLERYRMRGHRNTVDCCESRWRTPHTATCLIFRCLPVSIPPVAVQQWEDTAIQKITWSFQCPTEPRSEDAQTKSKAASK